MQLLEQKSHELSEDQERAADAIRHWLSSNSDEFIMAGYAGTGKTTVIRAVYEELKAAGSLFVTPTAKAAHVLHCKGVPACTIHSAIYLFGGVRENFRGDEVPVFSEREGFSDSLPFTPSRLVCDESSMINADMYRSIMDKGVPVMYVGDHGQLSCIGEDPKIMARPHIALEKYIAKLAIAASFAWHTIFGRAESHRVSMLAMTLRYCPSRIRD